jgi:hypothetical protein
VSLCGEGFGSAAAVHPSNADDVVIAGDSAGLAVAYVSFDRGSSWRRADSGLLGRVNCVGFATWPSYALFAGTTQGVYVSSDSGGSWRYSGLAQVRAVAFDSYYREIYAATRTGVYVSNNGGANWTAAGSGLANPDVLTLTLESYGYNAVALAGTNGTGLFRESFGHVGASEPARVPAGPEGKIRVVPNPTQGPATVSMSFSTATEVSGALYDRDGCRVATIGRQRALAGRWAWRWDPVALPAGVYFVRLSADGQSLAGRVVLVR